MSSRALDQLASEVTILANLLRKNAATLHQGDALPPGEFQVLQLLRRGGPATVPNLGRARVTSRQNIQITVNRLRAAGLVEVVANPAHKRSVLVQLTAQGHRSFETAEKRDEAHREELASKISEQDALHAVDFLRALRGLITADQGSATMARKPKPARRSGAVTQSLKTSVVPAKPNESPFEELPVNLL